MNLAALAKGLTDASQLEHAGHTTAQDIHAAHVRGTAEDPVGSGVDAASRDLGRKHRNLELARQADIALDAILGHGVLVPVKVQLLQHPPDVEGLFVRAVGAPGVVHQDHAVANRVMDGLTDTDIPGDVGGSTGIGLLRLGIPKVVGMDLVGSVAALQAVQGVLGIVLGHAHVWIGAGIGEHAVAAAAGVLEDGEARRASRQVP